MAKQSDPALKERVVLVGDGPLRSQLEERAAKPDLKGRVEFAGFKNQRELPEILEKLEGLRKEVEGL